MNYALLYNNDTFQIQTPSSDCKLHKKSSLPATRATLLLCTVSNEQTQLNDESGSFVVRKGGKREGSELSTFLKHLSRDERSSMEGVLHPPRCLCQLRGWKERKRLSADASSKVKVELLRNSAEQTL